MAYGFDKASTFGAFFPDGEFFGYKEHLKEYFQELQASGQASHKFFFDFNSDLIRDMHDGTDFIADDLLPKRYTLAKPYKALGDIIFLGAGIAISARLRALIEELEPHRHQIWPVEMVLPSGEPYPTEYFMLRVLTVLDAWDREQSDPDCWEKGRRIMTIAPLKEKNAHGIALKRSVIGDHHIWRGFVSPESGIWGFNFYVSDRLKAAIDAAGLKTTPFYQLKEV